MHRLGVVSCFFSEVDRIKGIVDQRPKRNETDLHGIERHADGGSGRTDVLERGRGRQVERSAQFANQLPAVQRVAQVHVAGRAVQDCNVQRINRNHTSTLH